MLQAAFVHPFVRKTTEALVSTGLLYWLLTGTYDHIVASGVPPILAAPLILGAFFGGGVTIEIVALVTIWKLG